MDLVAQRLLYSSKNTIQTQMLTSCTHAYDHITQQINNLSDTTQQAYTLWKRVHHYLPVIQPLTVILISWEESPSPEPQIDNNQVKIFQRNSLTE